MKRLGLTLQLFFLLGYCWLDGEARPLVARDAGVDAVAFGCGGLDGEARLQGLQRSPMLIASPPQPSLQLHQERHITGGGNVIEFRTPAPKGPDRIAQGSALGMGVHSMRQPQRGEIKVFRPFRAWSIQPSNTWGVAPGYWISLLRSLMGYHHPDGVWHQGGDGPSDRPFIPHGAFEIRSNQSQEQEQPAKPQQQEKPPPNQPEEKAKPDQPQQGESQKPPPTPQEKPVPSQEVPPPQTPTPADPTARSTGPEPQPTPAESRPDPQAESIAPAERTDTTPPAPEQPKPSPPATQPTLTGQEPAEQPPNIAARPETLQDQMARLVAELGDILSPFRILLAIFTLILVYLVDRILTLLLQRIAERRIRYATILRRAIPLLSLGLWFLAVLIVTGIFVRSLLALIIIFTVMALVVIFASQQIFRDVVGGIVIALERPFQIGDRIRIGGVSGEVLDIGLRSFQLLSPDGSVVVIPNAEAMHQSIANANPGIRESQVTAELLVPPQIGIDDAKRIAFEAAAASPYVFITEPIEIELEETYNNGSLLKLIVKAHVFDAQYERELKSDIIESARQGFEQRVGSLPR